MVKLGFLVVVCLLLASALVGHHIGSHPAAVMPDADEKVLLAHEAMASEDGGHLAASAMTCLALLVLAGLLLLPDARATSTPVQRMTQPLWTASRSTRARTPVSLSVVLVV